MGFLRRLFGNQVRPAERHTQQIPNPGEVEMALLAYERARFMDAIEARMDRITRILPNDVWDSAIGAKVRSPVRYEDVSWDFGNYIQEYSFLRPLQAGVPEDISRGMPPNVKQDKVKEYWYVTSMECLNSISKLVDDWEIHFQRRIESSQVGLASWYDLQLKYCLCYMNLYYCETHATIVLWNGRPDIEAQHRKTAGEWKVKCRLISHDLKMTMAHMESNQSMTELPFVGYVDEMWQFLGVNYPNR